MRAVLYEFGQIVPQGIANIKRIDAIIRDATIDFPDVVREECRDLLAQIAEKKARIETRTAQFTDVSRGSIAATRLQTMPGVGPMIALAVEAFTPAMTTFRSGRDFATWLGLVSRQFSSGGKDRLGRVSKAGQADIRRLLIIGAMSRVRAANRKPPASGSWLARMLMRKPKMLVAIALANKMARKIWAMLKKQEDYRSKRCRRWHDTCPAEYADTGERGVRSR
ncbi:IS110 family transposase [Neorhizobium galegae]|uniref:IS110 family transposase n=1 Tax=Neorhizobium galegae TaxID=399 RepID=UPI002102ADD7|nr:IS110 family transposase [Neorhizobium galegae]MCQ1769627.1 IS110 family transposase [Neorhizobium galegae]MCQ1775185.1 IS110 family transposase [Neorhizobium galegae]MCQ1781236.1 IS110 family transposase [Neorhizobium galegae]MCQ1797455.1 IS110 family transposase [Neorhizobium galegae]MCQ1849655.1 IS110 family transposase [Neorhizobium galegae]